MFITHGREEKPTDLFLEEEFPTQSRDALNLRPLTLIIF